MFFALIHCDELRRVFELDDVGDSFFTALKEADLTNELSLVDVPDFKVSAFSSNVEVVFVDLEKSSWLVVVLQGPDNGVASGLNVE